MPPTCLIFRWKDILQYRSDRGFNPMKSLIQTMPKVAEEVMNKCITFSDLPRRDPEYSVTFDFSLLAPFDGDSTEEKTLSWVQLLWLNRNVRTFSHIRCPKLFCGGSG